MDRRWMHANEKENINNVILRMKFFGIPDDDCDHLKLGCHFISCVGFFEREREMKMGMERGR